MCPCPCRPCPGRRTRAGLRGQRPHWAAAMQQARRFEGELLWLPKRARRPQALPLLVLVDVSGSMERYARLLLAFLHNATQGRPRAAFAFGTDLTDLRPAFRQRDTDHMLEMANAAIADFAGGTRLGASLATLARAPCAHAGRPPHRGLAHQRRPRYRRARGTECTRFCGSSATAASCCGSIPCCASMATRHWPAAPRCCNEHADGMLAVHNLSRLEDLAQAMARLMQR